MASTRKESDHAVENLKMVAEHYPELGDIMNSAINLITQGEKWRTLADNLGIALNKACAKVKKSSHA